MKLPITGEYMPREVSGGDNVYAGSVLQSGHVTVTVEKSRRRYISF